MTSDDECGLFACRPILYVENVARSIEYYVASLGFRLCWSWSDANQRFLEPGDDEVPTFAAVGRGLVQVMLSQRSQGAPGMWLHLDVHTAEQVDALHDEWIRQGAQVVEPPCLRPWGMYELRVLDPDGHTLRVSAPPRRNAEPGTAPEAAATT